MCVTLRGESVSFKEGSGTQGPFELPIDRRQVLKRVLGAK